MREVCIIGVGIHRFGRFPDKTFIDLGAKATLEALKDAGVGWEKIQAAYCGSVYNGSGAGSNMLAEVGLSGIPIMGRGGGLCGWRGGAEDGVSGDCPRGV